MLLTLIVKACRLVLTDGIKPMSDITNINSLKKQTIVGIKVDVSKPQYLCFYNRYGRLLFSVERDQIFDRTGNKFEIDL